MREQKEKKKDSVIWRKKKEIRERGGGRDGRGEREGRWRERGRERRERWGGMER
jgi:hypothetical protein